jgi:hypothetical protein
MRYMMPRGPARQLFSAGRGGDEAVPGGPSAGWFHLTTTCTVLRVTVREVRSSRALS